MGQPALREANDAPINEVSLYFAGYAVFGAGMAVGLTNIASGYVPMNVLESQRAN
jgi:V-type H+-transporting ATPase 21kDa proteolipid subunit